MGKNTVKKDILDKYGGAEHLQMPSRDVLVSQAETYVEFAPDGRVVKGQEIAIPKSKYLEDGMKQMRSYIGYLTGQSIDRNRHWVFRVLSVVSCQHSFEFFLCCVFILGLLLDFYHFVSLHQFWRATTVPYTALTGIRVNGVTHVATCFIAMHTVSAKPPLKNRPRQCP